MVLKGCARCGGDIYREEGLGEADMVCIQCGHRTAVVDVANRWRKLSAAGRTAPGEPRTQLSMRR